MHFIHLVETQQRKNLHHPTVQNFALPTLGKILHYPHLAKICTTQQRKILHYPHLAKICTTQQRKNLHHPHSAKILHHDTQRKNLHHPAAQINVLYLRILVYEWPISSARTPRL